MSLQLIDHSPDLQKLLNEGYNIEIRSGFLFIGDVPYIKSNREVDRGTLVIPLTTSGVATVKPHTHVAYWIGEFPCNADGTQMVSMGAPNQQQSLKINSDVSANHTLSRKPSSGSYDDYYQKVVTYIALLGGPVHSVNSEITAKTFKPYITGKEESVFKYADTSSSRAGIVPMVDKFKGKKIAIVGLGGTGSYILDLVAKTPVEEIHLFDSDLYLSHNAYRSPGAPSIDELQVVEKKVKRYDTIYSKMRYGIFPHETALNSSNVGLLENMDFVFLSMDPGKDKINVVEFLLDRNISFIDVGSGIYTKGDQLGGQVRVTFSSSTKNDHVKRNVIVEEGPNDYDQNIQIADLNALNAALAVIRWKKSVDFYFTTELENSSIYTLSSNDLFNGEFSNENIKTDN